MNFYQTIGFNPQHSASPAIEILQSRTPFERTAVIDSILNVAQPLIIADKLFRLERYCGSKVRLLLLDSDATWLMLGWNAQAEWEEVHAHLLVLQNLLVSAEFSDVQLDLAPEHTYQGGDCARISWTQAPQVKALYTGESGDITTHLRRLIAADPSRAWRIEDAASHMDMSSRSLQRYLLSEGGTFSSALRQARTELAKALLVAGDLSLAEIGFYCGYSDQAHFQREFRKTTATTPRHFRRSNQHPDAAKIKKVS